LYARKPEFIYFDGIITEALPGVKFKAKVERSKGLEPMILECQVKAIFKKRRIKIIKGDKVVIEVNPAIDIDPETGQAKGTIVERHF
jgi:translation initiation factor IF-1